MINFKNNIYRANLWLDNHEIIKLLLLLAFVACANIMMFTTHTFTRLLFGVFMWVFLLAFTLVRISINSGALKFDLNGYNIPQDGEEILVTKTFYYDGKFLKHAPNLTDPSIKPNTIRIDKGLTAKVNITAGSDSDVEMLLTFYRTTLPLSIHVKYFESRNHWTTLSDMRANMRANKLSKLV